MNDILDRVREGILTVDSEGTVTDANSAAARLLERDDAALIGADIRDAFPQSVESTFQNTYTDVKSSRSETTFEEFFPQLQTWIEVRIHPSDDGASVHLLDVTEKRRLRRESEARRDELTTLTRINDIIQEILQSLAGATTREEIERLICERLATTELYTFAWIGEHEVAAEQLTVRTLAGDHADMVERIREHSGGSDGGPEDAAITTGEPQIVQQLTTESAVPKAVRRKAFACGLQSCLAVPLTYGSTVYGALGVYTSRQNAFSPREQTSFETLGSLSGFAINATRQRNLLLSDTVVELTFQVTDTDAFFVTASERLECSLDIEGVVPLSTGSLLYYIRLDGATDDEFLDVAAGSSAIDVDRVVHDRDTECLFEVTVSGASPVLTLADYGATIRSAEFEEGRGEVVAEVSSGESIEGVVTSVQTEFPDSELLSKIELSRPVETVQEVRSELYDLLTDRQRTVLRTAYRADYFESPRGSTAEEIASTLDIASSTLHNHLRTAQRKLLEALFDEDETKDDRLGNV